MTGIGEVNAGVTTTERMLTVKDLAKILAVTERTVYRWIREGEVPKPMTVGRSKRWRKEAIDKWMAERI